MSSEKKLAPPVQIDSYVELRLTRPQTVKLPEVMDAMRHCRADITWQVLAGPVGGGHLALRFLSGLDDEMSEEAVPPGARMDVSILRPVPPLRLYEQLPRYVDGGIWEMRSQGVLNQDPSLSHAALVEHDLPFAIARGAEVFGLFNSWFGSGMNRIVTLLRWPDMDVFLRAAQEQQTDPDLLAIRDEERRRHGRPLSRGCDISLMTLLSPDQSDQIDTPRAG